MCYNIHVCYLVQLAPQRDGGIRLSANYMSAICVPLSSYDAVRCGIGSIVGIAMEYASLLTCILNRGAGTLDYGQHTSKTSKEFLALTHLRGFNESK